MTFIKKILMPAACMVTAFAATAGPLTVSARLDSVKMLMGNVTTVNLEVVQDENVKGYFPLLRLAAEKGRAAVAGDSVEIGAPISIDTVRVGSGRLQINYVVPVQAFDSGTYVLPPFHFVAGRDSAASKPLNLQIVPVKALATDSISPMAGVVEGKGASVLDSLPDWLYYYWWVILLAILAAIGCWWYIMRRKQAKPLVPKPVKVIDPADEALASLKNLKERKLWEQGREKEYFTDLTDILRRYLVRRFDINAMEMTSNDIIRALAESDANRSRDFVRRVLDMADFVKFAKVRPLPADNVKAYNDAYDFVKETAKRPDPQADSRTDAPAGSAAPKDNGTKGPDTVSGKGKEVES
ncbi:MAG: protein BatD [Bacteroidales bacterium]|nr:protein BatD [Bacteroidales bacterium]